MPKKLPLTAKQRQAKHKAKMDKFGIKRQQIKTSATERVMLELLRKKLEYTTVNEMILSELRELALEQGISLTDINKELASNGN